MFPDLSDMNLPALITELKLQMDKIRTASAIIDSIIVKLDVVKASSSTFKRKTDEELVSDATKKQRTPLSSSSSVPTVSPSILNVESHHQQKRTTTQQSSTFMDFEDHGFEFSAVRPKKRIFISRLPTDISEDVLNRHIRNRLNSPDVPIEVTMLSNRRNASYSSALIYVGEIKEIFDKVNHANFWPPLTVVHEHRPRKPNNGFRSKGRSNWGRN